LIGSLLAAQTLHRKHRSGKSVHRRNTGAVEHIRSDAKKRQAIGRWRQPLPVPALISHRPPRRRKQEPSRVGLAAPNGPEPNRYGDRKIGGRRIDF
jgi:hypothetical protein